MSNRQQRRAKKRILEGKRVGGGVVVPPEQAAAVRRERQGAPSGAPDAPPPARPIRVDPIDYELLADESARRAARRAERVRLDPSYEVASRLRSAVRARERDQVRAEERVRKWVLRCREQGMTWAAIGEILGTTGQAAGQRYGAASGGAEKSGA